MQAAHPAHALEMCGVCLVPTWAAVLFVQGFFAAGVFWCLPDSAAGLHFRFCLVPSAPGSILLAVILVACVASAVLSVGLCE